MIELEQKEVRKVIAAASASQRMAAQHDKSAWVSANAGAGKTRVLVDRVTRLLLGGTPPGRILCLTYTKAAAAEMSNRLFKRLGFWATASDQDLREKICALPGTEEKPDAALLASARNLFAHALETPGGLKIQTIHAFCERLLHRFPLESGVPAGFAILDDRERHELLGQAQREVLSRAAFEKKSGLAKAFDTVAGLIGEGTLDGLVSTMANHDGLKPHIALSAKSKERHFEALAKSWEIDLEDTTDTIILNFSKESRSVHDSYRDALRVLEGGPSTDQKKAVNINQAFESRTFKEHFHSLKPVFLKADNLPQKNVITVNNGKAFPQTRDFLEREQTRYFKTTLKLKAVVLLTANRALFELGGAIINRFEQLKHTRSRLDYNDLIARTDNVLSRSSDASWVLYKLDGGIDHVLIDEAQDTSPAQWKIVQHLTEEFFAGAGKTDKIRTIFAVGDEKQSIFSFQGANPEKFGEMQSWFEARAQDTWVNVPLNVSFRSTPVILEAVDLVFRQEAARKGVSWQEAHITHLPSRSAPGLVEIWPSIAAEPQRQEKPFPAPVDIPARRSPELLLADKISARINDWLSKGKILEARQRPIEPGDILILVRKRGIFADAMVRALKRRGIPVAGADRMRLMQQIAVLDLMSLGFFIAQPDDDLNLAALLKSPLLGLDEDDLFHLAAGRKKSLWGALAARKTKSAEIDLAFNRLERWRGEARRLRPFEFFTGILEGEGLREAMIRRLGSEADDPINEFLAQSLNYEQSHTASMQGFLAWLSAGDTQIKRDMEHGKNEVRIMTVHGAKGLEANVVFLPDTCSLPRPQDVPKLLDLPQEAESGTGLLVWGVNRPLSAQLLGAAYDLAADRQREEYNRLLYVAMTRARDELYICGFEKKTRPPADCWHTMVLKALAPVLEETLDENNEPLYWQLYRKTAPSEAERQNVSEPAEKSARLPQWALQQPLQEKRPQSPLTPSRLAAAEFGDGRNARPAALSPFEGGDTQRFKRGNLIHTLLEFLPQLAPQEREERAVSFLMRPGNDLSSNAAKEIVREVTLILGDERFAPYFGPQSRGEAPFAAQLSSGAGGGEQNLVFGQIDRMAILEREILILDYKTNRPPPKQVADVPEIYLRQMAAYGQALARMFPDKAIRCALLWTDAPRLMELPADLLGVHAPGNAI